MASSADFTAAYKECADEIKKLSETHQFPEVRSAGGCLLHAPASWRLLRAFGGPCQELSCLVTKDKRAMAMPVLLVGGWRFRSIPPTGVLYPRAARLPFALVCWRGRGQGWSSYFSQFFFVCDSSLSRCDQRPQYPAFPWSPWPQCLPSFDTRAHVSRAPAARQCVCLRTLTIDRACNRVPLAIEFVLQG